MPRFFVQTDTRIEFLRFCRCKKWYDKLRLDQGHQRYRSGLKKCLKAQCRVLLCTLMPELNSWDSVDAKNGLTCQDWTTDTRDNDWWPLDVHSFILKNRDKGVLLLVHFFTKRSTPFSRFFRIKEYLLNFFFFQTSTPFASKMDQKEYSFCFKNGPKGVLLLVKKEYSFSFKIPPEGVLLLVQGECIRDLHCLINIWKYSKTGSTSSPSSN